LGLVIRASVVFFADPKRTVIMIPKMNNMIRVRVRVRIRVRIRVKVRDSSRLRVRRLRARRLRVGEFGFGVR